MDSIREASNSNIHYRDSARKDTIRTILSNHTRLETPTIDSTVRLINSQGIAQFVPKDQYKKRGKT